MLTLPQIMNKTPKFRKLGARYVKLLRVRQGYTEEGRAFVACQSYSTHILDKELVPRKNKNPEKYVTVILFLNKKLQVSCSCSCPDFTFRWEYALTTKGASEIEYSNGEFPEITNPRLLPASCKHLVKLYEHIKPKLP